LDEEQIIENITEDPIVEDPTEDPIVEDPTEDPTVEDPTEDPIVEEPTIQDPVDEEPVVDEEVIDEEIVEEEVVLGGGGSPAPSYVTVASVVSTENADTATITGSTQPNADLYIKLTDANGNFIESDTGLYADSNGDFSVSLNTDGLKDGSYSVFVSAYVDVDDSGSTTSTGSDLDTFADVVATFTAPNNNTVVVSGTAEPESSVDITLTDSNSASTTTINVTADASGNYTSGNIDISGLNAIEFTLDVQSSDDDGTNIINTVTHTDAINVPYSNTLTGEHLGAYMWYDTSASSEEKSFMLERDETGSTTVTNTNGTFAFSSDVIRKFFNPASAELEVTDTVTTGATTATDYVASDIASLGDSKYVVTWIGFSDTDVDGGVYAQVFNSDGTKIGSEFLVNDGAANVYTSYKSSIKALDANNFMVVWTNDNGTDWDVNGKIYNLSNANSLTITKNDFVINSTVAGAQFEPTITSLGDKYIVSWTDGNIDGAGNGISGKIYDNTGTVVESDFQINTNTTGDQRFSKITSLGTDKFIVVWDGAAVDADTGVSAQVYSYDTTNGLATVGSEISVNTTYTSGSQGSPSVASMSGGNFVIVWDDDNNDGSGSGVFGQIFNSSGTKVGSEFQINSYILNEQHQSSVTGLGDNFIVTWKSYEQDGDLDGIFGQIFDSSGNTISGEFPINTVYTNEQRFPAITSMGNDKFIVTWQSNEQDNPNYGVYSQIYYLNKESEVISGAMNHTDFDIPDVGAYTGHISMGTIPFTQTLSDGVTTISGDYSLEIDNTGEFIIGWYDGAFNSGTIESEYNDMWYAGTPAVMGNLDPSVIYMYQQFKSLDMDAKFTLDSEGYFLFNSKTASGTFVDHNFYENGAASINGLVDVASGSVNVLVNELMLEPTFGELIFSEGEANGNIYGTNLQGFGIEGGHKEYINYTKSYEMTKENGAFISAGFLDLASTRSVPSSGTVALDGYTTILVNSEINGFSSTTADDVSISIDRDTGAISGSINSSGIATVPNGMTLSGTVSGRGSYYIMDDIFGVDITAGSYNDGTDDYSIYGKTGTLIAVPDSVDASDNFEMLEDESSWGYWTGLYASYSVADQVMYVDPRSTWVAGVQTDTSSALTNLYTFKGHVLGAVINGSDVDPIVFDSTNNVTLNFDFGGGSENFTGSIDFKTLNNDSWSATIGSGTVTGTDFSTSAITGTGAGDSISGSMNGTYYGTGDINSVGGRFGLSNGTKEALGVFKAVKQ
jgi:hypothetical protein